MAGSPDRVTSCGGYFPDNPYHEQRGWNSKTKTPVDSHALTTQFKLGRFCLLAVLQCLLTVDHVTVRVSVLAQPNTQQTVPEWLSDCADTSSQKTHTLHYKNKYVRARYLYHVGWLWALYRTHKYIEWNRTFSVQAGGAYSYHSVVKTKPCNIKPQ